MADYSQLDTVLLAAVNKLHETVDTPSVVINADTIAYYGEVFRIMRIAKLNKAKVVANVK